MVKLIRRPKGSSEDHRGAVLTQMVKEWGCWMWQVANGRVDVGKAPMGLDKVIPGRCTSKKAHRMLDGLTKVIITNINGKGTNGVR